MTSRAAELLQILDDLDHRGRKSEEGALGFMVRETEWQTIRKALATPPAPALDAATVERCAQVCEVVACTNVNSRYLGPEVNAMKCAAQIRVLLNAAKKQEGGS